MTQMSYRTLKGVSARPSSQPGLFGEVAVPPGLPLEHLRSALEDMLNGWELVVGTRHDAIDHYGESVAAMLEAAREALDLRRSL